MAEYARSMDKRRHAEDRRAVAKAYVARIHAAAAITSDDAIDERRRAAARREEAHALMMRRALDVEQGDDGACAKAIAREAAVAVGVAAAEANRAAAAARLAMASICSNDPDLRDLSAKLHLASISRERSQQVALRLRMADDERAAVASVDAVAEAMRAAAVAAERAAVDARRNGGGTVRVQLEAQLADKAVRGHIEAVGKAASERALVEAILEKIRTEDAIALAAKTATRNATAAAIEGYQAARATAIASAAATEREEVARIEAHARVAASRVAAAECTRAAEKTIRDAAYHAVVGEQEAARTAVEYEENLRWVLADAEAEKARAVSVAAQRASAERVKREVQADLDEQRRARMHVSETAAAQEASLIKQFLAKCEVDDRASAVAMAAQREAKKRFIVEIEQQRDKKMALAQAQGLQERQEADAIAERERFRRRVVEVARRRMLADHAELLQSGIIPRGILQTQDDVTLIRSFASVGGTLSDGQAHAALTAFRNAC